VVVRELVARFDGTGGGMTARGYCGIGIERPKKNANAGGLWRSAHAFNAAFVFTIGARYAGEASDTTKAWRHVPGFAFDGAEAFLAGMPEAAQVIAIECDAGRPTMPLSRFVHPERAVYVLGAEDRGVSATILNACSAVVEIPSRYCLNVATAGAIVLYDRVTKETA
jgi:tRNA G18 (ribose-2'-O)-methylase SpoU